MLCPSPHTVLLLAWTALTLGAAGQNVRDAAVELSASVTESPAAITLHWPSTPYPLTRQDLHRRVAGSTLWQPVATPLPTAAISFNDPDTAPGRTYEYRLVRTFSDAPHVAFGYLCAGLRVPVPDDRGRLILLVEQSLAAPLANEIQTLVTDLIGEGWAVTRLDVGAALSAPDVRALIQTAHAVDPEHSNSVVILGHLAVPYSGRTAPDLHGNHLGAWPTDAYYADIDGTWPDATVDIDSSFRPGNRNVPGDGKFDPSYVDGDRAPELAVGRIDFSDLPGAAWNEIELTRRYLSRNHAFRHALPPYAAVPRRALVDDHFGFFFGEAFAANGWREFSALVGRTECTEGQWMEELPNQAYLLAYGCGPGNMQQVGGVVTSTDFFTTPSRAVFNALFGSFFGDWDYPDNVLRASLAGPDGSLGLVAFWAGRPQIPLHLLGGGATIGDCLHAARLNAGDWRTGSLSGVFARGIQINLLGDPTLHLFPSAPPSGLTATPGPGSVALAWNAPATAGLEGYIISRASSPDGPFVRLRRDLVTDTAFTDRTIGPGLAGYYRVRPVVLAAHPGGTLLVPGQAAFASAQAGGPVPFPDLRITGNGLPVTNHDPAPSLANNTYAHGPGPIHFAITNVGEVPLTLSGPPVLSGPGAEQFRILSDPQTSVAPGQSTSLSVEFAPTTPGTVEATLSLVSNDHDQNPFLINLAGAAASPAGRFLTTPAIPAFGLLPDTTASQTILIENPGPGPLDFAIANPFHTYRSLGSNDPGGPVFVWNDISTNGPPVSFDDSDDAMSAPVPLGFPFPFGGSHRASFRICTNGYLTFSEAAASIANPPLPNPVAPPDLIAGFWQDLVLLPDSSVHVASTDGACTIQFTDVALVMEHDKRVTFQIVLRADGTISLFYQRVDVVPDFPVAGVQETYTTRGFNLPSPPAAHQAATIWPPDFGSWLAIDPATGTVAPGSSLPVALTINTAAAGPGLHRLELPVTSAGGAVPALMLPLAIEVAPDPSPRAAWRLAAFGDPSQAGPGTDNADPDHDGVSNIIEYALGSGPIETASRPALAASPTGFRFRRNAALYDIDLTAQLSNDLSVWTDAAVSQSGGPMQSLAWPVLDDSGPGDSKSVRIGIPPPPVFLRVQVAPGIRANLR